MEKLGEALAIVLVYLECRDENCTEDDDIAALESAVAVLNEATKAERLTIAQALGQIGKSELIDGFGLEEQSG